MSVVYTRLSKEFAEHGTGQGQALPPDGRALKQWLDDLPRGNPKETAETLRNALARSMVVSMESAARYNQLERIRATVHDAVLWLDRQYAGSPLPLTADRLFCAQLSQQLNVLMADGYRLACYALCAPDGTIGLLKSGAVSTALQRGIWHYQQCLLQSWQLYRSAPKNVWLGVHRCYQFALKVGMQGKNVDDPLRGRSTQVQDIYSETALLALMNPLAFSRPELEQMKSLAAGFARVCRVVNNNPSEHAARLPIDADLPVDSALPEDETAFLDFAPLYSALTKALQDAPSAGLVDLHLPDGETLNMQVALLARIQKAFGLASARTETRIYGDYPVQTLAGLSAIHYFAAGELDFDNYLQQLSQLNGQGLSLTADWLAPDNAIGQRLTATVRDHSLGGYRLQWSTDQALRARVGEIIAIHAGAIDLPADWMLCVVRWLRYENDGSVMAGLQLLTRRCVAAAVRIGAESQSSGLQRALDLQPMQVGQPRRLLISGAQLKSSVSLDVFYGHETHRLQSPRLHESFKVSPASLVANMDYSVLTEIT